VCICARRETKCKKGHSGNTSKGMKKLLGSVKLGKVRGRTVIRGIRTEQREKQTEMQEPKVAVAMSAGAKGAHLSRGGGR